MNTSVTGFPRVGRLRELKFATEKYFRKEITAAQLEETAKNIKKEQWNMQKKHQIDFIPSNDFSYYDAVLDTAVLLNVIQKKYAKLQLPALDTYFAMARGYQGENGDVTALAMKKWFNTNYHYIVPEIEDETIIELTGTKPFDEYLEAKAEGITTKPVIVGAFTFLKLARFCGEKQAEDFVNAIAQAYGDILKKFDELGASWVQFDEPYLVHDLSEGDIQLFIKLYNKILMRKGKVKVLLETYFGDIRDAYKEVVKLDFDGIGLDFVEGRKTRELVWNNGFPKDKTLFAGVVNGKNIWRNQYEKTFAILAELKEKACEVVIGTSCSLLHVPYTLENETKLTEEITKHFAFAHEKLGELAELKQLSVCEDVKNNTAYLANVKLFSEGRNASDPAVAKRVAEIAESDFVRLPEFEERERIQKEEFRLPIFPTTTIGSFPQTADVKAKRKAFRKGEITKEAYDAFLKEKIADCIRFQEEIGLDVLVHGEYERNDMVEYFGENLSGYLFTEKAWVQSYGTRCVKPPIVWGDVSRSKPMTVDWSVYAQSLTDKPMKGMLTGPVTILNWSFPREDISLKECAY